MKKATYTRRNTTTRTSYEDRIRAAQEQVRRIQAMEPGGNDLVVLEALSDRFDPETVFPRESVLPFAAWLAYGRHVAKGEHAVRVTTYVPMTRRDEATGASVPVTRPGKEEGQNVPVLRPVDAFLFDVRQTVPMETANPAFWSLPPHVAALLNPSASIDDEADAQSDDETDTTESTELFAATA